MNKILEHKELQRGIGRAPPAVRKHFQVWQDVAAHSGISGLALIRGFEDKPMRGHSRIWRMSRIGSAHWLVYRFAHQTFWLAELSRS